MTIRQPARLLALLAAASLLAACSSDATADDDAANLQVVTTFSIIGDIAAEIGGDEVTVHSIVPIGVDPHEYTPLPKDVQKSTNADILFWNGLNMEVGGGWFESLTEVADKKLETPEVVEVSVGVTPMYLASEDGGESEVNPHAFLDPNVGMIYAENVRDGLIEVDPDNRATYEANATKYLEALADIDAMYTEKIAEIPENHRVLVTSEHAFQYMTERYGLTSGYIWEIDTDELGSPEQINALIALVRASDVPALFVESNVDTRPMETISAETGVEIAGVVFSDELGKPGETGDIYLKMLTANIEQIHKGLS